MFLKTVPLWKKKKNPFPEPYLIYPPRSGPITTAWRVLRMRREEQPPIRRVAANKFNKQSRTDDEG